MKEPLSGAPPTRVAKLLTGTRICWAVALLAAPGPVVRLFKAPDTSPARRVARLLGARHLLQALWEYRKERNELLGAAIDGTHALTGVLFAVLAGRRWRRASAADAAIAAGFGAAGLWARQPRVAGLMRATLTTCVTPPKASFAAPWEVIRLAMCSAPNGSDCGRHEIP